MIRFSCRCKYQIEVPLEMAGTQIQCPECHRLVDVPSMDELAGIGEDGSYRMSAPPVVEDPHRFEEMRRVYSKEKVDEEGREVDLRQTHEQFLAAGSEDHFDDYSAVGTAPKYDPETGELIRPFDVKNEPQLVRQEPPTAVPMAQATLSYATPGLQERYSLFEPFVMLLSPINLAAMFFVLVAHLFMIMATVAVITSILAFTVVGAGLVAHYGVVIEEIGLEERDEVPRFLRHFNLMDDVWLPFAKVFLACMICFGVGWIVWIALVLAPGKHQPGLALAWLAVNIAGLIFFPGVLLITTTSGSVSNLRPDRVLGTIGKIGTRYAFFVVLYTVAFLVYMVGILLTPMHAISVFQAKFAAWVIDGAISWGSLILGIFLMHWFAWLMGMEYRTGHMRFPWVYQKFERYIPGVTGPRWSKQVAGLARSRGVDVRAARGEAPAAKPGG